VVAPGQGGYHVNGRTTYGHSMVVDYWGRVRDVLDKETGIVMIDIDLDALEQTRKTFPVLSHRCPPKHIESGKL
jgi:nitrilase